jgi:hypothetical protein
MNSPANTLKLMTPKNPIRDLHIGSPAREDEKGIGRMLMFYCTDCKRMIIAEDSESTDQVVDRLDEHVTKCPLAIFTYEATSGIARRKLGGLRSFLEGERLADRIRLQSPVPRVYQ